MVSGSADTVDVVGQLAAGGEVDLTTDRDQARAGKMLMPQHQRRGGGSRGVGRGLELPGGDHARTMNLSCRRLLLALRSGGVPWVFGLSRRGRSRPGRSVSRGG